MRITIFFITIVISLSLAHAATCPDLDTLPRPDEDLVPKLGFGADRDREVIKQISCLNYSENFLDGGEARINSNVISNYNDVYEKLKVTAGASASYFVFKASASATYEKIFHSKQFEKSFVLDYDIKFGTADATLDSNNPLNQTGQSYSNDACGFKRYCGNSYVCQTDKGANISVKLDFQFSSVYEKNEFTAEASAGIEGLEICCKPFSASLNASVERLSITTRKNSSVRIEAIQSGGYVEQLSRILGGSYVFTCSLDNLGDCTAALDTITQYVASEEFIAGVRELPSVSAYKNCPYEAIPSVPNLPQEATDAVQSARTSLGDKYLELLADRDTLEQTLSLTLSAERRQQLENLLTILDTDAEAVRQVGESCLNDLSNCPQKAAQVLAELRAYDRAVVHRNLMDGLVAFLPLDRNTNDVTGNGHDGVASKAIPTADRFGNLGAYYLDGTNTSYIEIADRPELSSPKFSISAWVEMTKVCSKGYECMIFNKEKSYELFYVYAHPLSWAIQRNKMPGWFAHYTSIKSVENEWRHLVLTYDGKNVDTYLNGKLIESFNYPGIVAKTNYPLRLGVRSIHSSSVTSVSMNGKIDDFRYHNRSLTAAEIQQLYQTTESKINQVPLAMFTTSAIQGAAPFTVNLDATASSDADGSISRYNWQSSDGQGASGTNTALTFTNAGEYSITLTVTDDQGATSQAVKTITATDIIIETPTCTNVPITDCRARYEFINNQGTVCAPCVVVPGAFGIPQIFALEMRQSNPLSLAFEVDPLTLKAHTFQDNCAAGYSPVTGSLNLPCVFVGTVDYSVDMQQRPGGLIFDVSGVR